MEWSAFDNKLETTRGLVSDYRLKKSGSDYILEVDARYSPEPKWNPPVVEKFSSIEAAKDFATKFEAAMTRQAALGYFVTQQDGIYARLGDDDKPCLVEAAKLPNGPKAGADSIRLKDVDIDVSSVWYGKTLRGLENARGVKTQFGTRSIFDNLAHHARDVALDAQALEAPLTLNSALGILRRGVMRNEQGMSLSTGFQAVDTTKGEKGYILFKTDPNLFFQTKPSGEITVSTCNYIRVKNDAPNAKKSEEFVYRAALTATEPLTKEKLVEILEKVSQPGPKAMFASDYKSHQDLLAHTIQGDITASLNPRSDLQLLPNPQRTKAPVVRADWRSAPTYVPMGA